MFDDFIKEAREFCAARGIKLSTLGRYAVGDRTLFDRLETGGQCLPRTMQRVRTYMAENPPAGMGKDDLRGQRQEAGA